MAEIIMPKMGDAMTEGKVVRWYKKAGDVVKKGEPVLEIETDKVNLDLEADQEGTLGDVAAEAGKMVEGSGVLATLLGPGEEGRPKKGGAAGPPAGATPSECGEVSGPPPPATVPGRWAGAMPQAASSISAPSGSGR